MSTLAAIQHPAINKAQVQQPASTQSRGQRPSIRINGYALIFTAATALTLATASECHSIFYPPSLLYGGVLWLWWSGIASLLWSLGLRRPLLSSFTTKAISIHTSAALILGIAHLLILGSLEFTDAAWRTRGTAFAMWTSMIHINRFGMEILIYGFIFGLIGIIQSQIRAQRDAIHALELQRQLSAAHLRALQMQLEPHFLFNTLNAITTLVELGRQKEAGEMLGHLNAILKSTLQRSTPEKVPLSQEIEIVENYLAIEQVRFADRLRIEIKIDPNALDGLVPCFLLQPIVENAIRHGIANCESSGLVQASAMLEGASLRLHVRNSGNGSRVTAQSGHGIGLKNTRERLTHFYPEEYAMQAQPLDAGGFEVAISIPYERR